MGVILNFVRKHSGRPVDHTRTLSGEISPFFPEMPSRPVLAGGWDGTAEDWNRRVDAFLNKVGPNYQPD